MIAEQNESIQYEVDKAEEAPANVEEVLSTAQEERHLSVLI
ncbi:MAG: hypothetical protein E6929_06975 [Clostridium sp.]|nr:hypothetical protein [Clostridium sp.]